MKVDEKYRVALHSLFWAVVLVAVKTVVAWMTGSLGIWSEALHSATDLLAALMTVVAVRQAAKPADDDHPYGHGKYENLSSLFQTLLLLGSCVWIFWEAIDRLIYDHPAPQFSWWTFIVIVFAIVVDWNRAHALGKAAHRHHSQALEADALHFSSDIFSSLAVLIGMVATNVGVKWADPVAAMVVGLVIFGIAFQLIRRSVDALMDRAPDGLTDKIAEIAADFLGPQSHPKVRVRPQGPSFHVDVVVQMDGEQPLLQVHDTCEELKKRIENNIPRTDVSVTAHPKAN